MAPRNESRVIHSVRWGDEEQVSSRKQRGIQWRGLRLDGSKQCNERSVPRKEVGLWSGL